MHLIRLYCKLLLVASVFFENGTWNRSVYAASSSDEYLYHTEEAANIIIDHEPPKGATDKELITPDFIYAPNQGPRVVEFYAPWCPHVRLCSRFLYILIECAIAHFSLFFSVNIFARTISNLPNKSRRL